MSTTRSIALPTTSPPKLRPNTHDNPRAVLDATAAFVQHYADTAYGRAIGFDEAQALTSLLYSGEAFESRVGIPCADAVLTSCRGLPAAPHVRINPISEDV
ncbi:hypothetical protein Pan258_21970 [Symmachiella dynata]|uniref:hypothetical protein n=1 Tax=Symmachiella dynata TaxID=2527995 RepID=UPI001187F7C4|nr:hypothetical protein [Symmachiella dynata]QDT48157.1 hypothetical protein Pan258_21970 [Symmachiella dynata]